MNKLIGIILITLAFLLPAHPAFAELDTSNPLLCSVINVAEYSLEEDCFEGTAETFDLPQFIRIDFQNNIISEVGENTRQRKSKISNFKRVDNSVILQGIENGRSWSVIVDKETGKMSATTSEARVGFVVFGACTSP